MGFSPISFEVDGIGFEHESSCIHLKTIPTERKKIILLLSEIWNFPSFYTSFPFYPI